LLSDETYQSAVLISKIAIELAYLQGKKTLTVANEMTINTHTNTNTRTHTHTHTHTHTQKLLGNYFLFEQFRT